jgi:hypothetical protein
LHSWLHGRGPGEKVAGFLRLHPVPPVHRGESGRHVSVHEHLPRCRHLRATKAQPSSCTTLSLWAIPKPTACSPAQCEPHTSPKSKPLKLARHKDAFAELVRWHLPLVYSAALRHVEGDATAAKEVAQSVFVAVQSRGDSAWRARIAMASMALARLRRG